MNHKQRVTGFQKWIPKVVNVSTNFPRYMQRIGRIHHLAETLSHFPLLTTGAHLATRTSTSLCDASRVFTWAVLLHALSMAVKTKQYFSFHSQNNAHRELDQQHTTATREQYNAQHLINHVPKHISTILAQPDTGLHCKYPADHPFQHARKLRKEIWTKVGGCFGAEETTRPKVVWLRRKKTLHRIEQTCYTNLC